MGVRKAEGKRVPFSKHQSFETLVEKYDGFIFDQYGVLHNGKSGLEGATDCVKVLAEKYDKKLIILSNSSAPSLSTINKLPKLGFDPENFVGAITSGEEACHFIKEQYGPGIDGCKKKALYITWKEKSSDSSSSKAIDFLKKCGIQATDKVEEADFVLLHGAEVLRRVMDNEDNNGGAIETSLGSFHKDGNMRLIKPILKECVKRKLPMVCANPDHIMVKPDGGHAHMPGKIAQYYEEALGGTCKSFGKPYVSHFETCLRDLNLSRNRVAHVGDSLHHDIAGANASGIDSIFVTGGIHREEIGCELESLPLKDDKLMNVFSKHGQFPTHIVPMVKF